MLGGVRMLLFERAVFENLVSGGVRPGLTHAVYEVDELDAEYARISALGAEVLVEPTQVSAAFGRRRLAFFRSPSGFVFEVMQVLIQLLLETRKLAIAAVRATLKSGRTSNRTCG